MPCYDPGPTDRESRSKEVAVLLVYVLQALGKKTTRQMRQAANDMYGDAASLDTFTAELCRQVRSLTPAQREKIVYDGRNRMARRLADWWEAHEAFDKARGEGS